MPPFLQRIINISNLYHPNQHLPHLFRDLKSGAQRGDQSSPLVFHPTVLHDSNHYKVDKTFRQSPEEERKTEQNKSLPSGSVQGEQLHLQRKSPRVSELTGNPSSLKLAQLPAFYVLSWAVLA